MSEKSDLIKKSLLKKNISAMVECYTSDKDRSGCKENEYCTIVENDCIGDDACSGVCMKKHWYNLYFQIWKSDVFKFRISMISKCFSWVDYILLYLKFFNKVILFRRNEIMCFYTQH